MTIHSDNQWSYEPRGTVIDRAIRFCLENKLVTGLITALFVVWGVAVAPFDWNIPWMHRSPVSVDAIPDIGENQQIVFTDWMGRSPRDVEDQVTYPLTTALLGVPQVKTVRSLSMFGFSSIYIIFNEKADFYSCRSRILEKLNSLPSNLLPPDVKPTLGPDATALGQVFWYTLEGRDEKNQPTGGWDLRELRSIQDWQVRLALQSAEGVSEVASVGGFVQEYQVDVDPDAMRAADVMLDNVVNAVRKANIDVGAGIIEVNKVQYVVRGKGFVRSVGDLEEAVVKVTDGVPLYVRNVGHVSIGPALRTGALDKEGTEAVGGVVVVRHGANPLDVIKSVKAKMAQIAPSLPSKMLADGRTSHVAVVPFYDRTGLIYETLGTLNSALYEQILVTTIVVLLMVMNMGGALLISSVMPLAILGAFIAMRLFGVEANIVSLSGIAIAIGTLVDMGIIMTDNIERRLREAPPGTPTLETVYCASCEVGSAVLTAISTTIVGFLPVFVMEGPEGKLFRPLAFTKTFALLASVIIALTVVPAAAHLLLTARITRRSVRIVTAIVLGIAGIVCAFVVSGWLGAALVLAAVWVGQKAFTSARASAHVTRVAYWLLIAAVIALLCIHWLPLGPEKGLAANFLFGGGVVVAFTSIYMLRQVIYEGVLRWCLAHKALFLTFPVLIMLWGLLGWLGFERLFGWLPGPVRLSAPMVAFAHAFPGMGREFMPPLDEGSYLYMPSAMPHASIGEVADILKKQDMAIRALPEIESVVGKLGRADSALDPAPIGMIETIVGYAPHYLVDHAGHRLTFKFDVRTTDVFRTESGAPVAAPDGSPYVVRGAFVRDAQGRLVPDNDGAPFRMWRPPLDPALNPGRAAWRGIQSPDDIWQAITRAAAVPGSTTAPKLQPIAARIVMLQTGIRAAMGVKIQGPSLEAIERTGFAIERLLKEVPSVDPTTVVADRIVGTPYLECVIDRDAIARHGLNIADVQDVIETAIGGMPATMTVEGRERYMVRVRYQRELRDSIESLGRIIVPTPTGAQVPLGQLARIENVRGPDMIKSENTRLVSYVLFDRRPEVAEVDAAEQAKAYLDQKRASGALSIPAGITFELTGNYENNLRAQKRLAMVIPVALAVVFLILYFQFRSVKVTALVYTAVPFAAAGGFIMLWLYNQPWFLDVSVAGVNMRELFQVHPINLSVAIWVGFVALFGLATDDGVIITTYLDEVFAAKQRATVAEVRDAVVEGGSRRMRACMMTTATAVLALLPVLTSTGRGADIMVPMTIPLFGGITVEMFTTLIVPVLYCAVKERHVARPRNC